MPSGPNYFSISRYIHCSCGFFVDILRGFCFKWDSAHISVQSMPSCFCIFLCAFQAAVTSILLYGCTTWTLTKRLEKKLDGNYTRMLRSILNKSWRQHPSRHQLYGHLPPITKTIQVRRTRNAGHCWISRDELIRDVLLWTPHTWPCKSRTTSTNIHSAAMWGYGMLSWRPT